MLSIRALLFPLSFQSTRLSVFSLAYVLGALFEYPFVSVPDYRDTIRLAELAYIRFRFGSIHICVVVASRGFIAGVLGLSLT